jgi:hypothetical protein
MSFCVGRAGARLSRPPPRVLLVVDAIIVLSYTYY